MTRRTQRAASDAAFVEAAALRHLRALEHEELNAHPEAHLDDWLAGDPRRRRAYEQVEASWHVARSLADDPEMRALREQALSRQRPERSRRLPAWAALAAGLALLLVASPILWGFVQLGGSAPETAVQAQTRLYRSGVGQRVTVALTDGSSAMLNTNSVLRVRYDGAERRLFLDRGQAYFRVAHGDRRRFRVSAANGDIVAHGTAFDVRLDQGRLAVALLEGEVGVRTPAGASVRMRPNQLLVATRSAHSLRPLGDPSLVTSWAEGFVVFDDRSVGEAAAEMNRYLTRPIVVADRGIAGQRISGTFRTGQSQAFVEALQHYFRLSIDERAADRIVITRR